MLEDDAALAACALAAWARRLASALPRAAAAALAIVVCALPGVAAAAVQGPASGTLDLATVGPFDEEFSTVAPGATGSPGARAYVGDVNGDAGDLGDIAIGVPTADPQGRTDAGSVYVLFGGGEGQGRGAFGSADLGNLGTRGYRIDGAAAGDRLGTSIEPLGYDLGDDGLSDFAVGAPGADSTRRNAGAVYLVSGVAGQRPSIDLATGDPSIVRVTGVAAGDGAGESLSAPPFTRRLFVGAPGADPQGLAGAGSVFVLTTLAAKVPEQRSVSLADVPGFRLDGRVAGGRAGAAVAYALDFDGDDRSEVVVGAPGVAPDADGTSAGEAYIVPFGTPGDVTTLGSGPDGGIIVPGLPGVRLGASVAGMSDVTGDGLGDVAIGAPTASPDDRRRAGSAFVIRSQRAPALPTPPPVQRFSASRIDGAAPFDHFGTVVSAANLDGGRAADDLLVSAPGADALARHNAGAVYALLGDRLDGIDLARLGDAGVRFAGPVAEDRSGTTLAVNAADRSLAAIGGRASTGLVRLRDPAPAPPAAASDPTRCAGSRDIELLVDGSPSMAAQVPYVRTAIDAMLSKPRSTPINVGAVVIGRRFREAFPPLSLAPGGFADARDLATLRLLLDEHVAADAGAPDYAQGLAAAVAARPAATALVLITDAAEPQPPAPLPAPGRPVYVLQLGDAHPPARSALEDVARRSGGEYLPGQDDSTLPEVLALLDAVLICDHALETTVASRPVAADPVSPEPGAQPVARTTLTPRFADKTFETRLRAETKTATLTISFKSGARGRSARRAACVRTRGVALDGLRVISGRSVVARVGTQGLRRALAGSVTAFGGVLSVTGRCGRGFLVLEVAGLERLPRAQANAAANSPTRLRVRMKLDKPPIKRAVAGAGTGSEKAKRRRRR